MWKYKLKERKQGWQLTLPLPMEGSRQEGYLFYGIEILVLQEQDGTMRDLVKRIQVLQLIIIRMKIFKI